MYLVPYWASLPVQSSAGRNGFDQIIVRPHERPHALRAELPEVITRHGHARWNGNRTDREGGADDDRQRPAGGRLH